MLDNVGNSILHFLVENKEYIVLLESLLAKHALDVNIQNINNDSPLHVAADYQNNEAIEILLKNGANPNICGRNGQTRNFYALFID